MCSYCGCRNIELIGRLSAQHDEIVNATSALRTAAAEQDLDAAAVACAGIARLLGPHTRLEERGLFTEMRRDDAFTAHIDALCEEHRAIDGELDAVAAGDLGRITPLIRLLRDHIDKEENGLFPAALASLENEQWDRLHVQQEDPAPGRTPVGSTTKGRT